MLQSMELQRVRNDLVTEQQQYICVHIYVYIWVCVCVCVCVYVCVRLCVHVCMCLLPKTKQLSTNYTK